MDSITQLHLQALQIQGRTTIEEYLDERERSLCHWLGTMKSCTDSDWPVTKVSVSDWLGLQNL